MRLRAALSPAVEARHNGGPVEIMQGLICSLAGAQRQARLAQASLKNGHGKKPTNELFRQPARLLAALLVMALSACRPPPEHGIEIRSAWAGATPPGSTVAAAYLEMAAHDADTLLSASTPLAEAVEMHLSFEEDGMTRMRPLQKVELTQGVPFKFEPGAAHLMLTGLHAPLVAGETFPLTLYFRRAGARIIEVTVSAPGATENTGH